VGLLRLLALRFRLLDVIDIPVIWIVAQAPANGACALLCMGALAKGEIMPEPKKGIKPDGAGGKGVEQTEVGGRGLVAYICAWCGSVNYIPSDWTYFVCWRDGCVNYVK
jgi:hypothetical protein